MRDAFPPVLALPASVILLSAITSSCAGSVIKGRKHPLNIDWDPAPPPEKGAPLSAGALRDKALLPAEIGGIVGAYAFVVVLIFIVLFLAGRRLRRVHEEAAKPREVEMLTAFPTNSQYYPSPVSPLSGGATAKNFSWPSPEKSEHNPYIFPTQNASPISPPESAVDAKTLEVDKQHLEQGLADLYAHVMEQEEAKARGLNIADMPKPYPPPSISPQRGNTSSSSSSKRRLEKPNPINLKAPETSHSRSSSLISSIKSPKRKGIRGMKISSPMPTPLSATFPAHYASDEEPLTPRHYHPHPPPPVPKDTPYMRSQEQYVSQPYLSHSRNASSVNTANNPSPVSPTRSIAEQMSTLSMRPPPNNRSIATSRPPNLMIPGSAANPHLVNNNVAANPTRQLPFRAFDPPPGLSSPSFSHSTKTTVLERTTPLSPGLKTPWSAGAVPYTPYQPFTPLVPVTPRLVTREDRKAMKRMEPKSPVMEMVASEEELWDGGY